MKNVLYEKIDRRYVPVSEYKTSDYIRGGHYLLHVQPGSTSWRYLLNPEYANLDAGLKEFKDLLVQELSEASKLRPISVKMSKKEIGAWEKYKEVMGEKNIPMYFGYDSFYDMVDNAIKKFREKIIEKK